MKKKTPTYPDHTVEDALRKHTTVMCLWEMPGPKNTRVAWLTAYAINGVLVIVMTYADGDGWEVLTPYESNSRAAAITDVMYRCGVTPKPID
jgi:hypothetical protein